MLFLCSFYIRWNFCSDTAFIEFYIAFFKRNVIFFQTDGVNFVSRVEGNNGVSTYIKRIEEIFPQDANVITCAGGGSVLSTFLQTTPFYSGRDLYLLIPRDSKMSNLAKLFICTVIQFNKYKYNYGRQANKTLP